MTRSPIRSMCADRQDWAHEDPESKSPSVNMALITRPMIERKMDMVSSETQSDAPSAPVTEAAASLDCPFDTRLARTPYLVIPKLALQAMPMDWRERLEALLCEADDLGMETPDYHVFRQGDGFSLLTRSDSEDPYSAISDLGVLRGDPWADYRRGHILDVCPTFKGKPE